MAAILHPFLTLLASLTRQELARQVAYLKAENQLLRSRVAEADHADQPAASQAR